MLSLMWAETPECEHHFHEAPTMNPSFRFWLRRLYGNTRWMYGPELWFKYSVYRPLRKLLCRHVWEDTGHWALNKKTRQVMTFSHTVWYCPKCDHDEMRPMGLDTKEFFFGEEGLMQHIILVEGDCLNLLRRII